MSNTGTRIAVVFRKLQDDNQYCLVIETDRLPDMYHDNIIKVIDSHEAQATVDLYTVFARRTFGDGLPMLETLHRRGDLRKVKISDVEMLPMPNRPVPLALINSHIDGSSPEVEIKAEVEDPEQKAKMLIAQANAMIEEANKKLEIAYGICPHMRPSVGRKKLDDDEKEARYQQRLLARKENRAKAKEAKLNDAKKAAVDSFIEKKLAQ